MKATTTATMTRKTTTSIIQILADAGAQLDVADVGGRTPLTFANGTFLAIRPPVAKPEAIALLQKLGAK